MAESDGFNTPQELYTMHDTCADSRHTPAQPFKKVKRKTPIIESQISFVEDPSFDLQEVTYEVIKEARVLTSPLNGGYLDRAVLFESIFTPHECEQLIELFSHFLSFWDPSSDADGKDTFRRSSTVEVNHKLIRDLISDRLVRAIHLKTRIDCDKRESTNDAMKNEQFSELNFLVNMHIPDNDSHPFHERDLVGTWSLKSASDDILFAKYDNCGHFSPHTDGCVVKDFDTRTFFTGLIYLTNNKLSSGATQLYVDEQKNRKLRHVNSSHYVFSPIVRENQDAEEYTCLTGEPELVARSVEPKEGALLLFHNSVMHESLPLRPGDSKYILRSDLIFERTPPILTEIKDKIAFDMYIKAQELAADNQCNESMELFRTCFLKSHLLAKIYGI